MRLLILSIVVAIAGCSGSNYATQTQTDSSAVRVSNLSSHLKTIPRIDVSGQGHTTVVKTRSSNASPLFVLDGMQMGTDFPRVMQLLDQNEYVSVEYLTTRRATIRYGERGVLGALEIRRISRTEN